MFWHCVAELFTDVYIAAALLPDSTVHLLRKNTESRGWEFLLWCSIYSGQELGSSLSKAPKVQHTLSALVIPISLMVCPSGASHLHVILPAP